MSINDLVQATVDRLNSHFESNSRVAKQELEKVKLEADRMAVVIERLRKKSVQEQQMVRGLIPDDFLNTRIFEDMRKIDREIDYSEASLKRCIQAGQEIEKQMETMRQYFNGEIQKIKALSID